MKKNIFKKIIISSLILVAFLGFTINKTYAKITPVAGSALGPSDNTSVVGPFNFSFKFYVTKEAGETDDDFVQLAFNVSVDGKIVSFIPYINGAQGKSTTLAYPFNQTLGNAMKMKQPITVTWSDLTPKDNTAKKYSWSLKDYWDSTSTGVFAQKSFNLKYTAPDTSGYYYVAKVKSTDSLSYFYTVSAKFSNETQCSTDWETFLSKFPGSTQYQECKKLAVAPDAPEDTTIPVVNEKTDYYPLAPLPGIGETCTDDGTGKTICVKTTPENCKTVDGVETCSPGPGFANYLNAMINLFIGICAVLAMIMIIMGGIQYMTSELISSKEEGKKKVTQAILGLLLALGSYAILNTINPDLLDISLSKLPTATMKITDPFTESSDQQTITSGNTCAGAYKINDPWPTGDDTKIRTALKKEEILGMDKRRCTFVGDSNCSSLTGFSISGQNGLINLKNACKSYGCDVIVTEATACWAHGNQNKVHTPNDKRGTVDLKLNAGLQKYIDAEFTCVDNYSWLKNAGGGKSIKCTKGSTIMYNERNTHWHVYSW